MSDNITLPRELVVRAMKAVMPMAYHTPPYERDEIAAILRTALAAEQPKPEPVATVGTQSNSAWKGYDGRWSPPGDPIKVVHLLRDLPLGTLLYAAPPEDESLRRDAERLREALRDTTVHLSAAVDLLKRGGRKATASDKMFVQMLTDYTKSFERGRAALRREET